MGALLLWVELDLVADDAVALPGLAFVLEWLFCGGSGVKEETGLTMVRLLSSSPEELVSWAGCPV